MKTKTSILLIEDDINLGEVVQDFLEINGFEVVRCLTGEDGWKAFTGRKFDLCILDIMLPKMDGFTILEFIRERDAHQPVILLTAKSMSDDKIKGLKLGADDYITKPFNLEEIKLRIHSVLKRQITPVKKEKNATVLRIGDFRLDLRNRILRYNDIETDLTNKEMSLLKLLFENKNSVVSREMAFKLIWEKDIELDSSSRSLDVYIVKLRKYLQLDDSINILNVHGSGYKLVIGK